MWAKGDILVLVNPWGDCPLPAGSIATVTEVVSRGTLRLAWDCPNPWNKNTMYGGMDKWAEKTGGPW